MSLKDVVLAALGTVLLVLLHMSAHATALKASGAAASAGAITMPRESAAVWPEVPRRRGVGAGKQETRVGTRQVFTTMRAAKRGANSASRAAARMPFPPGISRGRSLERSQA
jgi:hypothetical protein